MDILDEIRGLQADLARFRSFSSPPPFDDGFQLPFGISSQKGKVHMRCFWYSLYLFLFLGLVDFPSSEPVHVVGPLGATFLRQRTAHLRTDPSISRGASSSSVPPPPSSTGAVGTSGGGAATDVPPPTISDDSDIRRTLDHVLTVQVAQG